MNICAPAIVYIAFSLTHIIIDTYKQEFNTAFMKFLVMIVFTLLLNILCKRGLGIISWFIVFVPFIFMTIISSTLLFAFGLDPGSNTFIPKSLSKEN
jgi:Na+/H+-dicarboxylate symporter